MVISQPLGTLPPEMKGRAGRGPLGELRGGQAEQRHWTHHEELGAAGNRRPFCFQASPSEEE